MIDLDPKDTFCSILPQGCFLFFALLRQKKKKNNVTLGDEAVMKIHKKSELVHWK